MIRSGDLFCGAGETPPITTPTPADTPTVTPKDTLP